MNAELPNCTEVQALIVNGPEREETYSYDEYLGHRFSKHDTRREAFELFPERARANNAKVHR